MTLAYKGHASLPVRATVWVGLHPVMRVQYCSMPCMLHRCYCYLFVVVPWSVKLAKLSVLNQRHYTLGIARDTLTKALGKAYCALPLRASSTMLVQGLSGYVCKH